MTDVTPTTPVEPEPKKERKRRPLRDALGSVVYHERPEDTERFERIKELLVAASPKTTKLLKWMAGGGLGVVIALWTISDKGPWGLLNRWLERTWAQTDTLTEEVKKIAPAFVQVATTQKELAEEQKKSNELLSAILRNQAADNVKVDVKKVKVTPVGSSK